MSPNIETRTESISLTNTTTRSILDQSFCQGKEDNNKSLLQDKTKEGREKWSNCHHHEEKVGDEDDVILDNYYKYNLNLSSSSSLSFSPRNDDVDPKVVKALSSIRVLNDTTHHESWLQEFNGKLLDLPQDVLKALKRCAPTNFAARVADFNNNLFYNMQSQFGLKHLDLGLDYHDSGENDMNIDDLFQSILNAKQYLGSFLSTESTNSQPPHVDFEWEKLEEYGDDLRIGFFPLTEEGMFLQIWSRNDDRTRTATVEGEIIFIPCGKLLTLPADTIHGGGFRTDDMSSRYGNLRFHLYIASNEARLPQTQSNKYTEPGDKSRELEERYVDASIMKDLMECLFVHDGKH